MNDEPIFEVFTPLEFHVRTTSSYWELIVNVKHPAMYGHERDVEEVLRYLDEIRQSRSDPHVYLFYRLERPDRWICIVVKQLDNDGLIITTYPTDTIKEGQRVWTR